MSPSEPAEPGCHGDEARQTDPEESPGDTEGESPLTQTEQRTQQSQEDGQVGRRHRNTRPVKFTAHMLKRTLLIF